MKKLVTFFVLAYSLSWLIWFPLYATHFGINGLPVLPLHHALGGLGPLLAAFVTAGIFNGAAGIQLLLKRSFLIRPLWVTLTVIFSPAVLLIIAALMNWMINGAPIEWVKLFQPKEYPEWSLVTFSLYNLFFFGFGEEAGWRGFALPELLKKFSPLFAAIIITIFWAIWHWPLFLYRPGYTSMDTAGITGWVFSLLTGSLLISMFFEISSGSILICAVFHATIDIAFTANFSDTRITNYLGMLITFAGIAAAIYLWRRKTKRAIV